MSKYHVHTPFSRHQNLDRMVEMMGSIFPQDVRWTLVCEERERPDLAAGHRLPAFVEIMISDPHPADYFPGSWKSNWFYDHIKLEDDTRYCLINDDDFYEPDFFEKLDAHEGDLLLCSMARGRERTLIAQRENLHCGGIGGEQIIMSGRLQREFRLGKGYCGDWDMISAVIAKVLADGHPPVFVPEAFVWFNFLDGGVLWPGAFNPYAERMEYQDPTELARLLMYYIRLKPRRNVLEIGSMHGGTLWHWMHDVEPGGTVISIDSIVPDPDPRRAGQKFGHEVLWPFWAQQKKTAFLCLDADSRSPEIVRTVKERVLADGYLDFLFIDGGHDYETAKLDWENYGPLVRPGGMVAFHDLGKQWPDVRRVWEVARKTAAGSLELVVSPDQFGIGVLWK